MKQYLLDTNILGAYLRGRSGIINVAQNWIHNDEAATSIVVYGKIIEYFKNLLAISEISNCTSYTP